MSLPAGRFALNEGGPHGTIRARLGSKNLLVGGLMNAISLVEIHDSFMVEADEKNRPVAETQVLTLNMIHELVSEGFFVLGTPARASFHQWLTPLDDAIAEIKAAYVDNFDDPESWITMVWLFSTEKGTELGEKLYNTFR